MTMLRLIMQTSNSGDYESVLFTEDFETALEDFRNPKSESIKEVLLSVALPSDFPLEFELVAVK